jgi:hypothetical protein
MWSHLARVTAVAVFAIVPTLSPVSPAVAADLGQTVTRGPAAQGQDVCPEPNDTFQQACYLGPESDAQGFISNPNDVDAYRIEVLDFNTEVHVEMPSMPAAYKVELADWGGKIIASSSSSGNGQVIDTTVKIPGAYYIFVHSASGGFSPNRPYQIFRALTYPGASIPDIIDYADFRAGSATLFSGEHDLATFKENDGRYTITMKHGGSPDDPTRVWNTGLGTVLTDFTLTVDARVTNGVDGGFIIFFRKATDDNTDDNTYAVLVDGRDGQAILTRKSNGDATATDWAPSPMIDTKGGVNRVVIRCFEDEIRININGADVFNVSDGAIRQGRIGLGAISWGQPAEINFDNIIITTPTEGQDEE